MDFIAKEFDQLTTAELYEILKARLQVFMLEQDIRCQDMDDVDYKSRHYFIKKDGKILAYLRAFYADGDTVKIGRVLTIQRGVGLGADVMRKSIDDIKRNMSCRWICVNAQKQAAGFYEKLGFKVVSGEFLEEGIIHVAMQMEI